MKKFYNELTILKGIGIILVILGHSFTFIGKDLTTTNEVCLYLKKTIYSFHMPLFFFVSGLLVYSKEKIDLKKFYFSKIKRLMIPYLFFSILDYITRKLFLNFVNNKSNQIKDIFFYGGHIWFLYTMFILFLIYPFLKKCIQKDRAYILGIVIFLINYFEVFNNIKVFTINQLIYMIFYFYIGCIVKKIYIRYRKVGRFNKLYIGIGILFLLISYQYQSNILYKILYPFIGIYFFLIFSLKLKENNKIYNFIFFCGENTLQIYVLEGFVGTLLKIILLKLFPLNFFLVLIFFMSKLLILSIIIKVINSNFSLINKIFGIK